MRVVGVALLLSALTLCLVHTGPFRRFALARIHTYLLENRGLILGVKDFDYNLLSSRFELKQVTVKFSPSQPAGLTAGHVIVRISFWQLIQGSLENAQIWIDGLAVNWTETESGPGNWPAMHGAGGGSTYRMPAISAVNCELNFEDRRNGASIHLPNGRLSVAWSPARNEHSITFDSSAGYVQINQSRLALDQVQLNSALASSGFSVSSLRVASGESNAQISGTVTPSPARIEARGTLVVDLTELSASLGFPNFAQGRASAELSALGPLQDVKISGRLSSDRVVVRGTPITDATGTALFDPATGQLQVSTLSARVFSGQLTGSGNISTREDRRKSEFAAKLADIDPRQVARTVGFVIAYAPRASLDVTASWPGLELRRATFAGSARSLAARLNFRAACDLKSIRASLQAALGDGATSHGDIVISLPKQVLSGQFTGNIASVRATTSEMQHFVPRDRDSSFTQPLIDGTAHWSASLGGTLKVPTLSVQAAVNKLSVGNWKNADLQVDANLASDTVEIERAHLQWSDQQVNMSGRVGGLAADAPLYLEGKVEGSSLGSVFENLGFARLAEGSVVGTVQIRGSVARPAVESTLNLRDLTLVGERFARASVDAQWNNSELRLSRFQLEQDTESGTPAQLNGNGSVDVGTRQYVFSMVGQGLRPTSGSWPITGVFNIEAHGAGTLDNPTLSARVGSNDVRIGELMIGELRGEAEARDHRASGFITAPALNARVTSTIVMERDWPFELSLDAENTRIGTTPASSFDATMRGSGSLTASELDRMTATIRNLRLATPGQDTISDGPIQISYADRQLSVERLALTSGDSNLNVTGSIPLLEGTPGKISLQGRVVLDRFSSLFPELDGSTVTGAAQVSAALTGSGRHWTPTGSITIQDGGFRSPSVPVGIENLSGSLNIEDAIVHTEQIRGTIGTGRLSVEASLPLRLISPAFPNPTSNVGQPAQISAQIDDLRFTIGKEDKEATASFGVRITAKAPSFNLDALEGALDFSELRLQSAKSDFRQATPTRISIAGGVARLEGLSASGPNTSLSASGSIDLKGEKRLQLDATADMALAALAELAAPVESAGRMQLEAHVGGTLSEPRVTGFVTLQEGSLSLSDPSLQATDLNLKATLVGDEIKIDKLSGMLNGGSFTAGGDLKLTRGNVVSSSLQLSAKDVFLEYPAGVKTTSSVGLKLILRDNRPTLEGQIEIHDGYWDAPFETFGSGQKLNQTNVDTKARTADALALDVGIVTKRPVEMDNNLGRLAAAAKLRLLGTVTQPRVLGSLELEQDGRIYFGDRTYYIERGTIRFVDAPKPTPELDIHASTRAGTYTVNLGLTGQPKEITTTFTSDPPLPRDDVIAVLLTGKTIAENPGVDIRSLEGYALASGAISASLSNKLHRRFGVSRVSIQPAAVAAESNPGARITFTQDFTDTLRLMYSMNLSDSNDQIWVTEYDLSRRFTTRAVKQSDNTYRGEFRHDVRFGSSSMRPSSAPRPPMPKVSSVDFIGGSPFSPAELAKQFKIKAGQRPSGTKLRNSSEKLSRFLTDKGFLESRLQVERNDNGQDLSLAVRIETGSKVEMSYQGAKVPRKQKARVRNIWHAGISNQQRVDAAKNSILDYLAREGYLRAEVASEVLPGDDQKQVHFRLQPGARFRHIRIEVEGAEGDRARDVLALLQQPPLRQSVYRDPRRASVAVRRFYEERGYLAASMGAPKYELDAQRQTGRIVIPIEESRVFRVGTLQFTGNTALTSEDLRTGLPLEAGAVFEPARLEPSSTALKLKYGQLGYGDADIEYEIVRHDERAAVDIAFQVVENKQIAIGSVNVEGNRRTSAEFARSRMRVGSGDVANTTLIRESSTSLAQTGAYASVDMQLQPPADLGVGDQHTQIANLLVSVAEPKPFRLLYGGLYDSGGGPGFIADLQNHNSLGPGRILGLRLRSDPDTSEARLYVTRSFWREHRLSTTIATYFTRRTEYYQTTPTDRLGASIQQDLPLRSKWLLSYGYRFERQRGFVPDPSAPDVTADVVSVAPAIFTISRDARDSFLDATRGSFLSHGFQFAPRFLGSDYPYARYYLQYFKYFPLTRPRPVPFGERQERSRLVFASGWRLGFQKGFSQEGAVLTDRFYAGGGTTVRGFGQDQLGPKLANGQPAGGNAVVVLNNELRFPLFWFFDGVAFVDAGNVFPKASDFSFLDMRGAGGFGLRIRNPFVVLRFDYGLKFDRRPGEKAGAFFFSIGQAF